MSIKDKTQTGSLSLSKIVLSQNGPNTHFDRQAKKIYKLRNELQTVRKFQTLKSKMRAFFVVFFAISTGFANKITVDNGKLICEEGNCELDCNYGFVAQDKRFYPEDEPDLLDKAYCVFTMAFVVGN